MRVQHLLQQGRPRAWKPHHEYRRLLRVGRLKCRPFGVIGLGHTVFLDQRRFAIRLEPSWVDGFDTFDLDGMRGLQRRHGSRGVAQSVARVRQFEPVREVVFVAWACPLKDVACDRVATPALGKTSLQVSDFADHAFVRVGLVVLDHDALQYCLGLFDTIHPFVKSGQPQPHAAFFGPATRQFLHQLQRGYQVVLRRVSLCQLRVQVVIQRQPLPPGAKQVFGAKIAASRAGQRGVDADGG